MALTKVQNTGIADDAVTTDKIENSTVLAADLAASSVTNAKIATNTIGNDKLTNSSVTINGSSLSLGGSATLKHIDWQAVTVADGSTTLTATASKGYFLDTNTGVIEVFLPSSPSRGDTIVLADYSGTFSTNQIIINTGGQNIDSTVGTDFKVTTNNSIVELVYVDANKGWLVKLNQAAGTTPGTALDTFGGYDNVPPYIQATGGTITTSGDFKIHSFTGDGTFAVSSAPTPANNNVDYLVIAGGGSGGRAHGGGGGAGGYRESSGAASGCYTRSPLGACVAALPVTATSYPVTVGGGGAAPTTSPDFKGARGSNSVFSTITSTGGGNGSTESTTNSTGAGGSGGGGTYAPNPGTTPGGAGNTPPVSPAQGTAGGTGGTYGPGAASTGGGGGATAAGQNGSPSASGTGGAGATSCITGSPVARSGGGGGSATNYGAGSPSAGGSGGGGAGQARAGPGAGSPTPGTAGTANTGGGGGGGYGGPSPNVGGAGGKGVVIIRYRFQE